MLVHSHPIVAERVTFRTTLCWEMDTLLSAGKHEYRSKETCIPIHTNPVKSLYRTSLRRKMFKLPPHFIGKYLTVPITDLPLLYLYLCWGRRVGWKLFTLIKFDSASHPAPFPGLECQNRFLPRMHSRIFFWIACRIFMSSVLAAFSPTNKMYFICSKERRIVHKSTAFVVIKILWRRCMTHKDSWYIHKYQFWWTSEQSL